MNHDVPRDEAPFASLFAKLESEAAPPDRDALARLRAQTAEAFAAASHPSTTGERKRPMFFRATHWLGTVAAAAVIVAAVLFAFVIGPSGVALGQALDNSEKADTLRLRFRRGETKLEFWHTSKPERSRWDDLAGNYRIADGAKFWAVNESANEARRVNPPANVNRPVQHFLDLLGVPADRTKLRDARPVEQKREGNVDLLVYHVEVPTAGGKILLDCFVNADTKRLHSLRALMEKAGKNELLGELVAIAYDEPIGAEKFTIADTLTEDGRIGKVTDVQGIVGIKPVLHDRWTPVRAHLVLRPGDWIRTDARGANAAALRLVKQTGVILGPKTLVELIGPKQVRVVEGEVEITAAEGEIELISADGKKIEVKKKSQFFRAEKHQLVAVEKSPPWLLGFKGTTTNESLGSLVAMVDGRNVPLTVGYHKVSVDIRDQIARTTIEESFVNRTNEQLEGVFYFPLPQDASISGFGMWIGENLVEADVVEKQRAREIYETILRERRDPGLLEWNGGNIFKARVFPILPRSEKRIKITYTQVLPLKGSRYRYSYALQSELLQQHPLRELAIDVKVNSVVPLKSVASPTHPTRNDQTAHSAHVEFAAQEYVPTRDFEVVVDVEGRQSDVVVIPHRRGDDGYFMLQLSPPGPSGNWERPLLPNGEPVHLVILADTSASMGAGQRATQATLVASLLASLTAKDTFNLGACDVKCEWAFPQPLSADAANVVTGRDFLDKRTSLGWTNLDAAFAAAFKQCGPKTHVVYLGDGIVTTGDANPVAFANRLRRLYQGQTATLHAVSLGSSYESGVLKAIASLGGGSVRKIGGEQNAQSVALELLGEIAQPALRDVKVEFKGIKAARVYPESLANVPAGSQQILLGRYLPEGKDQAGEIVVTGTQGGKPVRFSTRVSLKDAEEGNSFIPRLWARMHLDSLLEQGTSEIIKDEIIALSEEYQIITPYTSLLVLETDADRERFKVKRRFQMRDGERFFADGRDNAVFDLAQKQMKRAGDWRTALRRSVLGELARLGRDARVFQPQYQRRLGQLHKLSEVSWDVNGPMSAAGGVPIEAAERLDVLGDRDSDGTDEFALGQKDIVDEFFGGDVLGRGGDLPASSPAPGEPFGGDFKAEPGFPEEAGVIGRLEDLAPFAGRPAGGLRGAYAIDEAESFGLRSSVGKAYRQTRSYGQWLNTLFPPLAGSPGAAKAPKSKWPAAARDLAKSLLRAEQLAKLTGGLEIVRQTDTTDPRWGDVTSRARRSEWFSAKAWVTRSESDGGQTLISWCDGKEIGIFSQAFQLGRIRAATPRDVQPPPLDLSDYSLTSLEQTYASHAAAVEPQGADRALLILTYPYNPKIERRILIDTARRVVLSVEDRRHGKVSGTMKFDDFVEAGGSWWARRIESTDEDGKRVWLVTQSIKTLTAAEVDQQMKAQLAGRAQTQFVHLPLPSVLDAKKSVAAGKATFEDQFVLLLHFLRSQQWPRVLDHLQEAEKLAAGRPGLRWVRSAILHDSRRHEELRKRYLDDAAQLAKSQAADAYFLAEYVLGQSSGVLQANEMLALLDDFKPLYDKQPPHVNARRHWLQMRMHRLNEAGRSDDAHVIRAQLAADYPRDESLQRQYAHALAERGEYPAAYAWLKRVLVKEAKWREHEEESLRSAYAQLLQQQGRFAELADYLGAWVKENPSSSSAYEQYLSALIRSDQIEKADALVLAWVKEAQVPGELPPPVAARIQAAIALMLGNAHHLHSNRIDERWLAPLTQTALFFAKHETGVSIADRIISQYQFRRTEESQRLRKTLAGILSAEIDKMPAERVRYFVSWLQTDDLEPADWKKIADVLRNRWSSETKDAEKHALGQVLIGILSNHAGPAEAIAFARLQWQKGPEEHRAEYANQLFDRLLAQPWTSEIEEGEVFAMFDKLSAAEDAGERLWSAVAALYRLTDRLLASRIAAGTKAIENPEKLTRTELRKKQSDIERQAREGLADRLRKEAAKHPKSLAQWLVAESGYLDAALDRNLKQVTAEAWEILGNVPPAPRKVDAEAAVEHALDDLLRQRALVTVMNAAARKGAAPELVERLAKYIDQAIAADAGEGHWKIVKYHFLVALDRTKELEQTLQKWTRQDDADSRWRIALAYLVAEQGRVAEAIQQFETVAAADELMPAAYRTLADWYLVEGKRDLHEKAALGVYKTSPEYYLSQTIAARLNLWLQPKGHLPTELDKEVLRMFAVLFEKSNVPQNYLHQIQRFYQASHDFRLLSGLPDAVVGHTAARVYPFVQGMKSVLDEVRDEATADEIVKHIATVRERAKTAVDHRALDLLEALVERRAAEVQNQAGPHVAKALAALERAAKREWSPGEPRLMADFLAGLGQITQKNLAAEQLRQLKELHPLAAAGSIDRLHIALRYATTLRRYDRLAEAIDVMQAALDEFQAANDGVLPVSANEALGSFITFLENAGHYARGEKALVAQLGHPVHAEQRRWLNQRLDELYHAALDQDGEVSLGKGLMLYQALHRKIQKGLAEMDQSYRYRSVIMLTQVYRTAKGKRLPGVVDDVREFAFKILPTVLKQQTTHYESAVNNVAYTVHDLIGARDGILFLLNEIDNEPRWLRENNQDGWSRHGYTLARWRTEAKDLGDVESRLLKLALKELRRDLVTREARMRALYHRQNDAAHFWKEKTADFAKTAEEVLAERNQSGATAQYVAEYFYWGLDERKRAIEVLLSAHARKLLDEDGQVRLVDFLHREQRHAESIPVLQPLVERRPENIEYRVQLMHSFFRANRKAELLALLKQTDAFFHEKNRWGETALAKLAKSTLENDLFEQSVAYFKELIPLHERTHSGRGVGNGTLAGYYIGLANAYAGLKKTPEAVDAAGGAIVAWGRRHEQRAQALETLKSVLARSPDLDAFVTEFDKRKEDSAIIRKALGEAYRGKKELAKAIKQLQLAVELQPNDAEIHQLLVTTFDEAGDKAAGLRQLLQAVQLSRRELKLYQDIGQRYSAAGQAQEAERAYTSIVEMLPTESESHALLAEIREKQDKWGEAIEHWEQVARIRALEPTGLLKLAAARIHEKQWDEARAALRKLESRSWPSRFGDVRGEVRKLEESLSKSK
jgi:Flp pilus assembly protein TadD